MKFLIALFAIFRMAMFPVWALIQVPTLLILATFWTRFGIRQMRFFMAGIAVLFRIKCRVFGKLDDYRPLLLIGNHISIFEIIAFPATFGNTFFAKAEAKKWWPVSWYIARFGNIFIDRRPAKAQEVIALIQRKVKTAKQPFGIFPEGTTNNGDYVLPFKSAMFDFITNGATDVRVQPIVIVYRDKHGQKIPPQVLADEYAYIANAKQTQPPYAKQELSIGKLLWKTMVRGGFTIEMHILPIWTAEDGMDRKEIATALHKIVSENFQKLK